ncbi:MAG: transposase [Acidimicrobiia bacterium]|nr:transposase [Acidimicrobiia bacterium]
MVLMSVNDESDNQPQQVDHRSKARWSVSKKVDVVMRLLRGESLDEVSRDVGVAAHRLAAWRDEFLEAGKAGLKGRKTRSDEDRRLAEAERKIGELTMDNEILRRITEKRGLQIPPAKRPR